MIHPVPFVTNPKSDSPPHPGEDQSSKRVKLDETPVMEEDPMLDAPVETRSSPEGGLVEAYVSVGGFLQGVPETQMTVNPIPDQEGQMDIDTEISKGIKAPSFKEKLLNSLSEDPEDEEDDIMLNQGDVSIGLNGNIPTVDFASHIIDTLNRKMGLVVVIKLLGRKIGFRHLRNQLQNIWKPANQIKIIDLHDDCFLVKFQDDLDYQNALLSGPWVIFGHYLSVQPCPQPQFRKFLWHDLDQLASNISSPWLLAGDFNDILHQDERKGGSVHRARGCCFFNKFLHSNGLVDLEFSGLRFTWRRGSLLMRLDRAICNPLWLQLFPNSSVDHLPKIMSDHRPIMINLGLFHLTGPMDPPFKFLAAWLSHYDFPTIIQRIWQSGDDLMSCIDSFKFEIQRWNVETFGLLAAAKDASSIVSMEFNPNWKTFQMRPPLSCPIWKHR
ncbi:hypothetical protein K1719_008944 [Acacia pycnantha]|nr:hypothetical protein K1719_008944 [Acacia pycnantha]